MKDESALKAAIKAVKEAEPRAVRMLLETSDQDYYGFVLNDLVLYGPSETLLSQVDEDALDTIRDDLWQHLCNLRWDGVVGEDKGGRADLALYKAPTKPFRVLRHDGRVRHYATIEERNAAAVRFARQDGANVITELWDLQHPQDELNEGWGSDGRVEPPVAVGV